MLLGETQPPVLRGPNGCHTQGATTQGGLAGELGSDWDLFIARVEGRRREVSAAPAVEWLIPGPPAGVLLPAARISGSGGPWLVLGVQERREDEAWVEQVPPDPCRWSCCDLASSFVGGACCGDPCSLGQPLAPRPTVCARDSESWL